MVDFKKLVGSRPAAREVDPLKIFASLDRRTSHAALRTAQEQALSELHRRREERDLVLKMPTGLGKSTVGLLFLQSHMVASGRGAVYLCPTVQLVHQTLDEATRLGVRAHEYPAGEPHPHADCSAGRAVTVCTYDKMFNGRSTFERRDVAFTPQALVCDDAHAGVEEVLDAFTLRVAGGDLLDKLRAPLVDACAERDPSQWEDVLAGRPGVAVEVPHWIWAGLQPQIRAVLQEHLDDPQVKFAWLRLRDHLPWTRVVLSSESLEITPLLPFVEDVAPFVGAKHRLFMSATLADDAVLVRSLGCSAPAARQPVIAGADSPPGERLVLATSLIHRSLDRAWVIEWAAKIATRHSVVALCPSRKLARAWQDAGAELGVGDNVESVVERLRSGALRFAVLAQRYDGVDLADDACRVLILDGMPYGETSTDIRDRSRQRTVGGPRGKLVHRIEQGLGRAVRSPADFAVAVLAGPELASFVSNVDVVRSFGRDLQLQLDVARELAAEAADAGTSPSAVDSIVGPLLRRDASWREYYDDRVRARLRSESPSPDEGAVRIAEQEREALAKASAGDALGASAVLTAAIAGASLPARRADLLEAKARYLHPHDPGEALRVQATAYRESRSVARPPAGAVIRPPTDHDAATRLLALLRLHTTGNGLVAEFDALRGELSFDRPASRFEAAVERFGDFLGADSRRPEAEGEQGPDNLMLWSDLSIVAEAKNEAKYSAIPKKDAEQLLHSVQWFRDHRLGSGDPVPLFFGPTARFDDGVHGPPGTRVVTREDLERLVDAVAKFVAGLAGKAAADWTNGDVHRLLADHGLNGRQLVDRYTKPVR